MLQLFEKIINEDGSSAILKDRLTILKDMYAEIEKACAELQAKNGALQSELEQERSRADRLQNELDTLKSGVFAKYVCDHCGSPKLTRKGNRPDPTFGDLGVKQLIFSCQACGQESAFIEERL
ncbi:hypothetical protein [Chitiniphilus shinanonensis]|uniref:hypothetical protein n=1 Tax=Chitiniphilus shinanonensis TaxID=553088 RepID=UPI003059730F